MAQSQTFNSRLRLLVAKSYKAEKLYSSLRSEVTFQNPDHLSRVTSASGIAEIANDLRAREWQRLHNELRTALNEILSDTTPANQPRAIAGLLEMFRERFDQDRAYLEENIETLVDASNREEFGHVLKLSLELIRIKSRAQASKAISDELNSVLQPLSRSYDSIPPEMSNEKPVQEAEISARPSNVIPLRRKVG